jgi:DNA-directed RNA polymerase specialized sigma24 family protein
MKEQHMSELSDDLWSRVYDVAVEAIQHYARGIVTAGFLTERVICALREQRIEEWQVSNTLLARLAQRICSSELYNAWHSSDSDVRNWAFDNLRCYLKRSLRHVSYMVSLREYGYTMEDVLHQTLEVLHRMLTNDAHAGPDDPAAFLKWAQVILIRNAHALLEKCQRETCLSLDAQSEPFVELLVDKRNSDPLEYVLSQELQQKVGEAILAMRNPRYQQVLISTYLVGEDECELAQRLHVQVQDIYMWRHRALKTLRNNQEVMRTLRSLRE